MEFKSAHAVFALVCLAVWATAFDAHADNPGAEDKKPATSSKKSPQKKTPPKKSETQKEVKTPASVPTVKNNTPPQKAPPPGDGAKTTPPPVGKKGPSSKTPRSANTPSAPKAAGAKKPPVLFVDRDGDGINDGKEYRFRRRVKSKGRDRREIRRRGGNSPLQRRAPQQQGPAGQ